MIWRGYTISLLRMGGVSPRVFSSFLLERLLELHKENPTSNLQSPQILCGEQKGVNSEVSKGAEENQLGAAFGDGARGGGRGGCWWSRVGALANPGEQGKAAPTTRPPARPQPPPVHPPRRPQTRKAGVGRCGPPGEEDASWGSQGLGGEGESSVPVVLRTAAAPGNWTPRSSRRWDPWALAPGALSPSAASAAARPGKPTLAAGAAASAAEGAAAAAAARAAGAPAAATWAARRGWPRAGGAASPAAGAARPTGGQPPAGPAAPPGPVRGTAAAPVGGAREGIRARVRPPGSRPRAASPVTG